MGEIRKNMWGWGIDVYHFWTIFEKFARSLNNVVQTRFLLENAIEATAQHERSDVAVVMVLLHLLQADDVGVGILGGQDVEDALLLGVVQGLTNSHLRGRARCRTARSQTRGVGRGGGVTRQPRP